MADKVNLEAAANAGAAVAVALPALLASEQVKKDQDGIRVSLVKLDAAIHANAVQCLLHAGKHGDTSLMRRLLVDIVDAKSGYRRQGLIAWMREFSPMELNGSVITLSGMIDGERRPFRVAEANATPFTSLSKADELTGEKPLFRDALTSRVQGAITAYRDAVANTVFTPGQPPKAIDPKKPFYNGIHLDKMEAGFDAIANILAGMSSFPDTTKDEYKARKTIAVAELAEAAAAKK